MPPKRKASSKKAKASKARKKPSKKAGAKSSKRGKTGKPKLDRARSAYQFFVSERRAEVLRAHGLAGRPDAFGEAQRLLAQAWQALDDHSRAPFEAAAALDRHRKAVEGLAASAPPQQLAATLGDCVAGIGAAAALGATALPPDRVLTAMEAIDGRLTSSVRSAVALRLGSGAGGDGATVDAVRSAYGAAAADRLRAFLRRFRGAVSGQIEAAAAPPRPKPQAKPQAEAKAAKPQAEAKAKPQSEELGEETRSRVVGLLMRTVAKAAGKANFALCRRIEDALHASAGREPKEYKRRARSLAFNLGASDGALLNRVVNGELAPVDLVRLDAEELASDALKAERREERERYFRSEVHDVAGPPKRRRDLLFAATISPGMSRGSLAAVEEPEETQASQASQQDGAQDTPAPGLGPPPLADAPPPLAAEPTGLSSEDSSAESSGEEGSESSSGESSSSGEGGSAGVASGMKVAAASSPPGAPPARAAGSTADAATQAATAQAAASSASSPSQSPPRAGAAEAQHWCEDDEELARALAAVSPTSSSSSSSPSSPFASPAQAPGAHNADAEHAQQLLAMGFAQEQSDAALRTAKGDIRRAVSLLCQDGASRPPRQA